ncbi:MAG: hypothetical protein ACI4GY_07385 [Acutalibacteraceae bacterium]
MFLPISVSYENAIEAFANYCSKSSTPEDIFNFDGCIPEARLKYSPILTYYAEYSYTALVEITTETQVHSKSALAPDSTSYRENRRNSNSGFFAQMYEDFADTRYTDSTVKQKDMDRSSGKDCFLVFGSTGQLDSVDEKLWPSEKIDQSCIIDDILDYRIRSNPICAKAVDNCIAIANIDNAQLPEAKIDYIIRSDINETLRNRYKNSSFEIVDFNYEIDSSTLNTNLLCFPYYEFSFSYNSIPYIVRVAAHCQAEGSTGLFGSNKDVVTGNLPVFEKMPGGIFSKLSAKRSRSVGKKSGKEHFLSTISKSMVLTA